MKTEDNELIAEFMELTSPPNPDFKYWTQDGAMNAWQLKYDSLWEWLMPVIDKIRSEWGNDVILNGDLTVIKKTKGFKTKGFKKIEVLESGSIQSAYKAVLLYIEWYNKNIYKKKKL
jgi:hypothetical protein